MGIQARLGNEGAPSTNPRAAGGPPAGTPGEEITLMIPEVFPPLVIVAVVQPDGWFADEVYDRIAAARAGG
jgi:hypothetical protein